MKNNIKYIVLDFDGTILNSKGELSINLQNKLIKLQQDGYKIILCSGRSIYGIKWVAQKIDLAKYGGYIVAYNGSQIYEYRNEKLEKLHNLEFTKKQVQDIEKLVKNHAIAFTTYCENCLATNNIIERLERSSKIMGLEISTKYIKKTPKILLYVEKSRLEELLSLIEIKIKNYNEKLNIFSSISDIIEITPEFASKGEALKKLCEIRNMNKDQFICFGDNGNDISMFLFCKYSVGMENGISKIKKIATHKTKSNEEDGVYLFLKNNF